MDVLREAVGSGAASHGLGLAAVPERYFHSPDEAFTIYERALQGQTFLATQAPAVSTQAKHLKFSFVPLHLFLHFIRPFLQAGQSSMQRCNPER